MGNVCGTLCLTLCCEPCCGQCPCCERGDMPLFESHLTATRITTMLRNGGAFENILTVTNVKVTPLPAGDGLLSIMFRLGLEYEPANAGPATVICKLTPRPTETRIIGLVLGLFSAEIQYYAKDMGSKSGMSGPKPYFYKYYGYGRYALLLEDMAPTKTMTWTGGVSFQQSQIAIKNVAKLHARYRGNVCDHDDTKDWVLRIDDSNYWGKIIPDAFKSSYKILDENRYQVFGVELKEVSCFHDAATYINENIELFIEVLFENMKRKNENAMFKTTFVHGDFHVENMFFISPGENGPTFKCIDYQLVKEFTGTIDVLVFIACSLPIDVRQQHEKELIKLYYNEMHANGASDLTISELLLSYIFNLFVGVLMMVIGQKNGDFTTQTAKEKYMCVFPRVNQMLIDWKWMDAIKIFLLKSPKGVTKLTQDEVRQIIPEMYHDLLDLDRDNDLDQKCAI